MNWTKEYDRSLRSVMECMAVAQRDAAATVDSISRELADELVKRRATLRNEHLAAQEALAQAWKSDSLKECTKVVGNLVCLALAVEQMQDRMSDTANLEKILIARRHTSAGRLDAARAELLRIIRATQPRPARETSAYACECALPPAAMAELQSLGRQDHAAELAELDRAAA